LTHRESEITATRAIAADSKQLGEIAQRMTAFNSRADAEIAKIHPFEEHFQMQTRAMQSALAKEQSVFPPEATVALRSQINGAIYRAGGESFQLHRSLQSAHGDFETKGSAILNDANTLNKKPIAFRDRSN
jgi:hypothetical protein